MQSIPPINLASPGVAADVVATVKAKMGGIPNIFATMAQSPAVLEGFLAFGDALSKGRLNAAIREQIALTVAGENECDYCASAHTFIAKSAGVSAEEAARNLRGSATDPKTAAILKFARDVVVTRGIPGDDALDAIREAGVSDSEIVEILANVAINIFTNYFNHVAGTEIDFPSVTAAASKSAA